MSTRHYWIQSNKSFKYLATFLDVGCKGDNVNNLSVINEYTFMRSKIKKLFIKEIGLS